MNTLLSPELPPMPIQTSQKDFQPVYSDPAALGRALAALGEMPGITTPNRIMVVRKNLASIALSNIDDPSQIFVTGACEREITDPDTAIQQISAQAQIAQEVFPHDLHVSRDLVQDKKPRSEDYEDVNDTETGEVVRVMTYRGSGIHGYNVADRDPDPQRLIIGMENAQAVASELPELVSFHEALLVNFEESMSRSENGKNYIVSGDILGIGDRTRYEGSPQLEMLKNVDNPISIKIGPTATPHDIQMLENTLNPDHEPGKTMFTLRFGVNHLENTDAIIKAIKEFAPGSLIICDPMHGNTVKTSLNGEPIKTRYMDDMVREIVAVMNSCQINGLKLHGLHLEASGSSDRLECIKNQHHSPRDIAVVDPQLNNAQLREILTIYRQLLKAQVRLLQ